MSVKGSGEGLVAVASDPGMAAGMARVVWAGKSAPTHFGGPSPAKAAGGGAPAQRRRPVGGPGPAKAAGGGALPREGGRWWGGPGSVKAAGGGALPREGGRCLADYDAVLTEAGDYTAKYFMLRSLFESILGTQLPFCWGAGHPREVVGVGRRGKGSLWAET